MSAASCSDRLRTLAGSPSANAVSPAPHRCRLINMDQTAHVVAPWRCDAFNPRPPEVRPDHVRFAPQTAASYFRFCPAADPSHFIRCVRFQALRGHSENWCRESPIGQSLPGVTYSDQGQR
jgi:hypothetical protein